MAAEHGLSPALSAAVAQFDERPRAIGVNALTSAAQTRRAQAEALMVDPHAFGTDESYAERRMLLDQAESLERTACFLELPSYTVDRADLDFAAHVLDNAAADTMGEENALLRARLFETAVWLREYRRMLTLRLGPQVTVVSPHLRGGRAKVRGHMRRLKGSHGWHHGA